jgi:hypothetical protein
MMTHGFGGPTGDPLAVMWRMLGARMQGVPA